MSHCMRHFEEPYVADCQTCGRPFCSRCLVFPHGPNKPPYCIGCALNASGVRNKSLVRVAPTAAPTGGDRRLERAQRKAERKAAKAEAKAARQAAKLEPVLPADGSRPSTVPAPERMTMPAARFAPHGAGTDQPIS